MLNKIPAGAKKNLEGSIQVGQLATSANIHDPKKWGILDPLRVMIQSLFSSGPSSHDVSLRYALAQFAACHTQKSTEEILNEMDAFTDALDLRSLILFRVTQACLALSYSAYLILTLTFIQGMFDTYSQGIWWCLYIILAGVSSIIALLFFVRHTYAYGWGTPKVPMEPPYNPKYDEGLRAAIDAFLGELRKEQGVGVYFYRHALFAIEPKTLDRRVFFGKCCNLLFSEHGYFRGMVPLYGRLASRRVDFFIRQENLQKLLDSLKPKRKAGPGRNYCGRFEAALMCLSSNHFADKLDLDQQDAAIKEIRSALDNWYQELPAAGEEGPKPEEVKKQASGIYNGLRLNKKLERMRARFAID